MVYKVLRNTVKIIAEQTMPERAESLKQPR